MLHGTFIVQIRLLAMFLMATNSVLNAEMILLPRLEIPRTTVKDRELNLQWLMPMADQRVVRVLSNLLYGPPYCIG
jgi:hypothetical protein